MLVVLVVFFTLAARLYNLPGRVCRFMPRVSSIARSRFLRETRDLITLCATMHAEHVQQSHSRRRRTCARIFDANSSATKASAAAEGDRAPILRLRPGNTGRAANVPCTPDMKCWLVLSGAGWCCRVLAGVVGCWLALSGAGWCLINKIERCCLFCSRTLKKQRCV